MRIGSTAAWLMFGTLITTLAPLCCFEREEATDTPSYNRDTQKLFEEKSDIKFPKMKDLLSKLENDRVLSDKGSNIAFLYNSVVSRKEEACETELLEACVVLAVMDDDLREGPAYEWMSTEVIELAKIRFAKAFEGIHSKRSGRIVRRSEVYKYDEIKVFLDERGKVDIFHFDRPLNRYMHPSTGSVHKFR